MYLLAAIPLALASATPAHGVPSDRAVDYEYVYDLSDFTGPVRTSFARLAYDAVADEVLVVGSRVAVFDDRGMELFDFGANEALGHVADIVMLPNATMVALRRVGTEHALITCNFRGEPQGPLVLSGLPANLEASFAPDAIATAAGRLYLLDSDTFRVAVTDEHGAYERGYELASLLELDDTKLADNDIRGFAVDRDGNLLLTIPTLFTGYVVSPDGEVRTFGGAGSKPGQFNIAGAIASDELGTLYVTDLLRAVVMVFDRDLQFRGEFGYRGGHPGGLVLPVDVVAGRGAVYVAQGASRGVAVFRVSPPPAPPGEVGAVPVSQRSLSASGSPTASLVSPTEGD